MQKTEAILLRKQEMRETSLILHAFTRSLGKIHGLAKGVRGARAAVPWHLEPLTHQALVVYERKRSQMALISQFDLIDAFEPIRRDWVRTAYASLCLDLTDVMTELNDPHPELFDLLLSVLKALETAADPRSVARYFEAHLLKQIGVLPEVESLQLCPGSLASLRQIFQTPADRISRLCLSRKVDEELRGVFQGFFTQLHDRELRTRRFLASVGLESIAQPVLQAHQESA